MTEKAQGAAPPRLLVLPPRYAILTNEAECLRQRAKEMDAERRAMRRAAMEAAGWKRCCRCWPSMVAEDGFCGCCLYNHVTGEQIEQPTSFFAGEQEASAPQAPPSTKTQGIPKATE